MKCIACGAENNLRDRTEHRGRCSKCHHPFVFEPTTMTPPARFTDGFFAKAIADLSAENTLFFTPEQLYYFLNRRLKRKANTNKPFGCLVLFLVPLIMLMAFFGAGITEAGNYFLVSYWLVAMAGLVGLAIATAHSVYINPRSGIGQRRDTATGLQWVGGAAIVLAIATSLYFQEEVGAVQAFLGFTANVLMGMGAIVVGYLQKSRLGETTEEPLINRSQVRDWLHRWTAVNGEPPKLMTSPNQGTEVEINPEISAYSFDRLIVVESEAIAQMLIANNVHLEHNAAILSITGYPQTIFSTVMEMLRRNPNLTVYALHNASPTGVAMVHQLTTDPQWFREETATVIDLGLLPRQILAAGMYAVYTSDSMAREAKQLPSPVRQKLSPDELRWLDAGKFVELEAFGPQKLLNVIRSGIALGIATDSNQLTAWDDGGNWMLFTTDSFG